jgi:hypothetical protein
MDVPADWKTWIWYVIPGSILLLALYLTFEWFKCIHFSAPITLIVSFIIGFFAHTIYRLLSYKKIRERSVINDLSGMDRLYKKCEDNLEKLNAIYLRDYFSLDKREELVKAIKNKSIWGNAWGTITLATLTGATLLIISGYVLLAIAYLLGFVLAILSYNKNWHSMEEYEDMLITMSPKEIPLKRV